MAGCYQNELKTRDRQCFQAAAKNIGERRASSLKAKQNESEHREKLWILVRPKSSMPVEGRNLRTALYF
jgi:hypothetical protein